MVRISLIPRVEIYSTFVTFLDNFGHFLTPAHKDWGYSCPLRRPGNGGMHKLVGAPQPRPMHGFSPNFQGMFTKKHLELIKFWGVSGNNCCHGNNLKIFGCEVCGCPTA